MLRILLRDAAVYGASTLLTRAVSLVVVPLYTRVLDPREYGAIDILSIFGSLITLTVALEINQAVARFMPDAGSEESRRRLVSTAFTFAAAAYLLFLGIALALIDPIRQLLVGDNTSSATVAIALLAIGAVGMFQLAQNILRFLLRPLAFTTASVVFSVVGVALGAALVIGFNAGIAGVFIGQLIGGILGTAAAVVPVRHLYRPAVTWPALRQMLAFSVPLVPASVGVFVTLYIDRIALTALATLAAVGVFGIAYRLASVITLVLVGFQMALTPLIYQRYREPSTPADLARIFRLFVALALLVSMTLSIWAPEILRMLTTPAYFSAETLVPMLTPAVLLSSMYVFMPGLAIARRTGTIGAITIGGALMNTTLNFLLIPLLGIEGAAVATLATSLAVFGAYVFASQRTYRVPHRWPPIVVAGISYVALVIPGLMVEAGSMPALVLKPLLMAGMAAIIVLIGLIDRDEIRRAVARISPSTSSSC